MKHTTLLINGSPHKAGNTSIALAEIAKALEDEGIAAEVFWIGAKPVKVTQNGEYAVRPLRICRGVLV